MNLPAFKETPPVFKILLVVCLFIVGVMIFSFIRRLEFSQNQPAQLLRILLWFGVCVGFYLTKKWAWIIFVALLLFSILNIIHAVLSRRMGLSLYPLISISIGAALLWLLNLQNIRTLFQIDFRKGKVQPAETANFAVLCIALSLFVIVEILGIGRVAISSIPAKLFLGFLGFSFILLGIGIWQINQYAFQSALSFLIFTTIAVTIIVLYDFVEAHRFMALQKSVFYILLCLGMLIYWIKSVRPKLPTEDFHAA